MPKSFAAYYVYDYRRDRNAFEFEAASDLVALSEFAEWYNSVVRPDRWEGRRLGRYWLFCVQRGLDGSLLKPRPVSVDENVRLDKAAFFWADPPYDEASERRREAEFARLDALDMARLQARPANVFAEFLDDGKGRASRR